MINNINQTLVALMSKNSKKSGNADANTDAFQSLLAALMNQSVNFQGNNISALQGALQGQITEVLGQNSGEKNTADIFGINQSLMRMLSKLNDSTGDVQSGTGDGLKEFDELMKVFLNGKEQEASNYGIDIKAVDDLLADLTKNKTMANQEADVKETAQGDMTITQEIIDSLTALKSKVTQDVLNEQSFKTDIALENTEIVLKSEEQNNKNVGITQESDNYKLNSEVKAKIVEKSSESQFIVARPEVLRMLKGETAKVNVKSENVGSQSPVSAKIETKDIPQSIIQKTELFAEMNSEEKKGESTELKQDAGIQISDIQGSQRVQYTSFETKHTAVVNKDDVINQVLDKVKLINGKDMSELHISLRPESLGEVSIKLVMEKGAMTAKIVVENSQVKSLIDSNLPQIKESLKNQNIDVSNFNVSVNLGQGDLPNNRDFNFHRWTFNKRGSSRAINSEDEGRIEAIRSREVYTQRSGLNLLA